MKLKITITFIVIFIVSGLFSQNCEAYIPTKVGEKLTYKTSNKKGKVQSYYSQELLSKKTEDGALKYEVLRANYDKKKELTSQDTLAFFCKDNAFFIDMSSYLNQEQMATYEDADIKIDFDNISYPANMKVGSVLKDGYVKADLTMGMIMMTFRTDIKNTKVVSLEQIIKEAGSFQTQKVTEDLAVKVGFMTISMKSISWVKTNVGNIKTESYDKNDNLISVTELVSIQ